MSNLDNVKEGDTVALQTGWHSTGFHSGIAIYEKAVVKKVTVKEVTVNGKRFLKRNGFLFGAGNYPGPRELRIHALTPDMEKIININILLVAEDKKRQSYLRIIENAKFKDLDTSKLAKLAAILQEKTGNE
jgi:hypothetical protein